MIYLVDGLCTRENSTKIQRILERHFPVVKLDWHAWELLCRRMAPLLLRQRNDVWIVTSDNSLFSFPMLYRDQGVGIDSNNTFWVYYKYLLYDNEESLLDIATHQLKSLYRNGDGTTDDKELKNHIFFVDTATNRGMEQLIYAISRKHGNV